ncbi:MAG: PIN domain-containing protein [Candidatus Wallbacteria bacterium]|nr:PIN domain-containing protein [Candidatus Wallbacteria bacterium]
MKPQSDAGARKFFVDTALFIYFVEGHTEYDNKVKKFFSLIQLGRISAATSVLTLTELLTKPARDNNICLCDKFQTMLAEGGHFELIEISREISIMAGNLRGKYAFLKAVDSLQIAASIRAGSEVFLTNDRKLKKVNETVVWTIDDLKINGRS